MIEGRDLELPGLSKEGGYFRPAKGMRLDTLLSEAQLERVEEFVVADEDSIHAVDDEATGFLDELSAS